MADIIPEIQERRARRGFSDKPVSRETVERILTAGTMAASCSNKQSWRFMACTEGEGLETAREALLGGNYWAKVAPVLVVVTTRDELDCQLNDNRNYAQFDTGMAVAGMLLQATREGMYAHPMAGFDPLKLRESFGIEAETSVITIIAIGYPGDASNLNEKHAASEVSERERKELNEVVQWNSWSSLS
ncbi:MAG: nitroreductase family protein [Spirochaeta sp.]|jgi:nitroreductase|nr:nitroreductase family protein [Spirochaeta sp.]